MVIPEADWEAAFASPATVAPKAASVDQSKVGWKKPPFPSPYILLTSSEATPAKGEQALCICVTLDVRIIFLKSWDVWLNILWYRDVVNKGVLLGQ